MNQCYAYQIWILLYHLFDPSCQEDQGFVCGGGTTAHLPSSYESALLYWSTHLFTAEKVKESYLLRVNRFYLRQTVMDIWY